MNLFLYLPLVHCCPDEKDGLQFMNFSSHSSQLHSVSSLSRVIDTFGKFIQEISASLSFDDPTHLVSCDRTPKCNL